MIASGGKVQLAREDVRLCVECVQDAMAAWTERAIGWDRRAEDCRGMGAHHGAAQHDERAEKARRRVRRLRALMHKLQRALEEVSDGSM